MFASPLFNHLVSLFVSVVASRACVCILPCVAAHILWFMKRDAGLPCMKQAVSAVNVVSLRICTGVCTFWNRGSLKRSARAVRAQCNYLGVRPY